ncbi:MAG: MGMT family protein [Flavipsychrobacter sp.]|nr:MGMT family protein [Flavipsychrobacter sp.]
MKAKQDNEDIYKAIYEVVRSIPKGRVSSYGAVAQAIGLKSGARMVARAMSHNGKGERAFPAQRVVNSTGVLSGDNGRRQQLLEAEGVQVKDGKVVNFKAVFWDPLKEMEV